ncbi:MAG: Crp/Fnr family transcriptional regulator [Bacteroidaceae bacterium]|jgi:CRP-like cAMP-binding protein|nr:Crp/Fnr family transcriptional regulator [Bacteroidaceae bacterium]MBQ5912157.1 Crp/Fnr family transcriptional regulator [Bacteroidaceae bacterium]
MTKKRIPWEEYLEKISDMLSTLTPEQREELLSHVSVVKYKKNDVIYSEGDLPTNLLCLVSGKVKIYKDGVGGRPQIMRVLGDTEYFAYRAYMAGEPFITAASAFEPCTVLKVPLEIIVDLIQRNATLAWFFIQKLAHDLGKSDERTVNLTQKHIRGRLAESLLFLKESYGLEEDGSTLSIYLSREDLANLSNMTTSNAIRTLSAFASEKLVAIDGRKIKFINIAELEKISKIG